MPRYYGPGEAIRILTDPEIRARRGYCAQTVGDAFGMHLGDAHQWPAQLVRRGWRPVPIDEMQPGDVVINPHMAGGEGHIGIGVLDERGLPAYVSNYEGRRMVRRFEQGFTAYRAPYRVNVVPFDASAPAGRARIVLPGQPPARAAEPVAYQPPPLTPSPLGDLGPLGPLPQPSPMAPLRNILSNVIAGTPTPTAEQRAAYEPLRQLVEGVTMPTFATPQVQQAVVEGATAPLVPFGTVSRFSAQWVRDALARAQGEDLADDPSLGQRILRAVVPTTPGQQESWTEVMQELGSQVDTADMSPGMKTFVQAAFLVGGIATDVLTDPLSYAGFGTHALSPKALRYAALKETKPMVQAAIAAGADGTEFLPKLTRWFDRQHAGANMWDMLRAGGQHQERVTQKLTTYMVDKLSVAEDAAPDLARRMVGTWKDVLQRPVSAVLPFTNLGYPIPGTARARDKIRLTFGLRGHGFRPASDPQYLLQRRGAIGRIRILTGTDPLIPFGSQDEALLYPIERRYDIARVKATQSLQKDVTSYGLEGAVRNWATDQSLRIRMEQAAGRSGSMPMLTPQGTADEIIGAMADQIALDEVRNPRSQAVLGQRAKRFFNPYSDMPEYWAKATRTTHGASRQRSRSVHGQIEALFHGITDQEDRALYWWTNSHPDRVVRALAGSEAEANYLRVPAARRLHDLLVATGEINNIPEVIDLAGATNWESALTRYITMENDVAGVTDALAEVAPRAHHLIAEVYDKHSRKLLDKLWDIDIANIRTLRSLGVDIEEPAYRVSYVPSYVARSVDAILDDIRIGNVAITPEARQAFQQQKKFGHGTEMLLKSVEDAMDTGAEIDLPILSLRTVLHMRSAQSVAVQNYLEHYRMIRKWGVSVNDARAAKLARLAGWTPVPRHGTISQVLGSADEAKYAQRLAGTVGAVRQARLRALQAEDNLADAMARVNEELRRPPVAVAEREGTLPVTEPRAEYEMPTVPMAEETAPIRAEWVIGRESYAQIGRQAKQDRFTLQPRGLSGKTRYELSVGPDKLSPEALRELDAKFAGTTYGYLWLHPRLTERSFLEAYWLDQLPLGTPGREEALEAWLRKYDLQDKRPPRPRKPLVTSDDVARQAIRDRRFREARENKREAVLAYVHQRGDSLIGEGGELAEEWVGFQAVVEPHMAALHETVTVAQEEMRAAQQAVARAEHLRAELDAIRQERRIEERARLQGVPQAQHDEIRQDLAKFYDPREQSIRQELESIPGVVPLRRRPQRLEAPPVREPEVTPSPELRRAYAQLRRATSADRRAQLGVARRERSYRKLPAAHQQGDWDPNLADWLVPPEIVRQYQQTHAAAAGPGALKLVADALMTWPRGNVLVSTAFHVFNAIDNWIVGRWLAGQAMLFDAYEGREKQSLRGRALQTMNVFRNGANAMRTLLAMTLRDVGEVQPKHWTTRLARWADGLLGRIVGSEDASVIARWQRELDKADIVEHNWSSVFGGGGRTGTWNVPRGLAAVQKEGAAVRVAKAPLRGWGSVMAYNRRVGMFLEDVPRVATYITARQSGYSMSEAKALVDASFVNYARDIARPFDDFMRNITMFWPYMRERSEQLLTSYFRRPANLVFAEAVRDRPLGQRATLSTPFGDVPVSLLPSSADRWAPSDRFLFKYGLKGRLGFLRGDYVPIRVPYDENGQPTGPFAKLIRLVHANDTLRGAYAATEGAGNGDHYLFMRTGISIHELQERMMQIVGGDPESLGESTQPVIRVAGEAIFGEGQPGWGKWARAAGKSLVGAYVPGGRFLPLVTPPRAVSPNRRDYQLRVLYAQERKALQRRQMIVGQLGLRFYSVPQAEMLRNMSKEQRMEFYSMQRQEAGGE